jgi:RNA polymerase sigma-19 factor, ECF subfamily
MNPTEEITWRQIQQKDIRVFENYYKEHYKEFFLVSYKYVKTTALAQEIVNDVFVKIWEDAEKITIESSLKSYIYRSVINRSINALNKQKKELQNQRELAHLPEETYELKEIETNELKVKLYKAIDALPEQCKKVFLMSRFDNMKQQEIADKLGISIKTVKNHITNALKQLRNSTGYTVIIFIGALNIFFIISRAMINFPCLIIIMYGIFI